MMSSFERNTCSNISSRSAISSSGVSPNAASGSSAIMMGFPSLSLRQIEDACRPTATVLLSADDSLRRKENELVLREIQEIKDALIAFEFAVQSAELPNSGGRLKTHGGAQAAGLLRSPIAENVDWYFVERITVALFSAVFAEL